MTVWIVFILGGLITFFWRGAFLLFGERVQLPAWTDRPLRYVAPAAFAAIAVPATLGDDGLGSLTPPTAQVLGVIATVIVVARWRSVPAGLAAGLAIYGVVSWLV